MDYILDTIPALIRIPTYQFPNRGLHSEPDATLEVYSVPSERTLHFGGGKKLTRQHPVFVQDCRFCGAFDVRSITFRIKHTTQLHCRMCPFQTSRAIIGKQLPVICV